MGEAVRSAHLRDRIEIRRDGLPLFLDQIRVDGDLTADLGRPTLGSGAQAVALLIVVSPRAEALQEALRPALPETAGLSLIGGDCLVARLLAADSFEMRASLIPLLQQLVGALPRPWMI
jgi:urease accessory protein